MNISIYTILKSFCFYLLWEKRLPFACWQSTEKIIFFYNLYGVCCLSASESTRKNVSNRKKKNYCISNSTVRREGFILPTRIKIRVKIKYKWRKIRLPSHGFIKYFCAHVLNHIFTIYLANERPLKVSTKTASTNIKIKIMGWT